jgi:hypothetical protein
MANRAVKTPAKKIKAEHANQYCTDSIEIATLPSWAVAMVVRAESIAKEPPPFAATISWRHDRMFCAD